MCRITIRWREDMLYLEQNRHFRDEYDGTIKDMKPIDNLMID